MPVKNLRHLPKAHLHLHLEGAMRPATLTEFCERYKIKRPSDTRGKQFSNFAAFNEVYRAASDSIRTRQDLARVIQEVAEDAAKDLEGPVGAGVISQADAAAYREEHGIKAPEAAPAEAAPQQPQR